MCMGHPAFELSSELEKWKDVVQVVQTQTRKQKEKRPYSALRVSEAVSHINCEQFKTRKELWNWQEKLLEIQR